MPANRTKGIAIGVVNFLTAMGLFMASQKSSSNSRKIWQKMQMKPRESVLEVVKQTD